MPGALSNTIGISDQQSRKANISVLLVRTLSEIKAVDTGKESFAKTTLIPGHLKSCAREKDGTYVTTEVTSPWLNIGWTCNFDSSPHTQIQQPRVEALLAQGA